MEQQLTKDEASEYLAMARQVTALPNSLTLRQARRFRNLAVRYAAANPREPMAQLWADHATLVCADQLTAPTPRVPATVAPRDPAPAVIDLRDPTPVPPPPPAPPPAPDTSVSPSYSDEVLLAAILHNNG